MSVSARPVAMYGMYFETREAVVQFLADNGYPDVDIDDDFADAVEMPVVCLNNYTGRGFILGLHIPVGETLDEAIAHWQKYFKPEVAVKADTHLECAWC